LQKLNSSTSLASSSDTYERLLKQRILQMNEFELMREILINDNLNTQQTMEIVKSKINEPKHNTLPNVEANVETKDILILSKRMVRDVMPVILRDRNCTWKVNFSSFNKKIYLNWSVCEALVNLGINCVDAFKVKTLIGTHKKSMSERNGFKYSATISKWSILVDEKTGEKKCIFELMPVMFEGVMTPYEIVVRCENCDMNRFDLEKQLTEYTNSIWLGKDDKKTNKLWNANIAFTQTLFNCK
jgi:hypothetical protein